MQEYAIWDRKTKEYEPLRADYRTEIAPGVILFLRTDQIRVTYTAKKAKKTNTIIRLAEAIKRYGVLEPLEVRIVHENDGTIAYELLGNEQCWHAARIAGLDKLPCIIPKTAADEQEAAILEQIRQKKLHIFDQAEAFRLLMQKYGLTQSEIAHRIGISQSAVANKLRLLRFSAEQRRDILEYGLSERHARALLRLQPCEIRDAILEIYEKRLTVAATEMLVEQKTCREPQAEETTPLSDIDFEKQAPNVSAYQGVKPQKFVLHTLQPLYNSLERTLNILRKTGRTVEMERNVGDNGVEIVIRVPRT